MSDTRGWKVGDRVQVTSIRWPKRRNQPRLPSPVGTITGFTEHEGGRVSALIQFDHLVNGLDSCSATPRELLAVNRVEESAALLEALDTNDRLETENAELKKRRYWTQYVEPKEGDGVDW